MNCFRTLDESGTPVDVTSSDVNNYLRQVSGSDFTVKDFRTWAGPCWLHALCRNLKSSASQTEAKRNLQKAVEADGRMLAEIRQLSVDAVTSIPSWSIAILTVPLSRV